MADSKIPSVVQRHPAELGGPVAMAIAFLIGQLLGVENENTVFAIAIVLSFVPAAITWVVGLIRS